MTTRVKRRAYRSPLRTARAEETRRAVIEAAGALFVERGYVGTTIEAIAGRAEVSPETVYATYRNKGALLARLVDVTLAGDHSDVPILQREWVARIADEPDPRGALRIMAGNGRRILERIAPIYDVLVGAAGADAGARGVLERYRDQRLAAQRQLVRMIARRHRLRPGLSARAAADIVYAIGSPETYRLLVHDRGWSASRWERWYADTLVAQIIDSSRLAPRRAIDA